MRGRPGGGARGGAGHAGLGPDPEAALRRGGLEAALRRGGGVDLGLRRGAGLTRIVCPQVVPRQPDQSAGRAHADACTQGRGLPGAETERAQLLRHFLPVRG